MNEHDGKGRDVGDQRGARCNVNQTFNFTVGAVAVVAALVILYMLFW